MADLSRRPRRFALAGALWTATCAVMVIFGVRSAWVGDTITIRPGRCPRTSSGPRFCVSSECGGLRIALTNANSGCFVWLENPSPEELRPYDLITYERFAGPPGYPKVGPNSWWNLIGVHYDWDRPSDRIFCGTLVFPYYMPIVAAVLTSAWVFWRKFPRLTRQPESGLCPRCGYNLTANATGVCPECGTAVAARPAPHETF